MGRFFSDFDEAWEYFLARPDPLEWFFGDFSEDEAFVAEAWVIVPPAEIKRAAVDIQRALAPFHWLAPIPEDFLHVAIGLTSALEEHPRGMRGSGAFEAAYQRVNCFHSGVVVEVRAPRLLDLVADTRMDVSTFLPHMTRRRDARATRSGRASDRFNAVAESRPWRDRGQRASSCSLPCRTGDPAPALGGCRNRAARVRVWPVQCSGMSPDEAVNRLERERSCRTPSKQRLGR